jgi:SAM-dependent methyltransferase
VRPDRYVLYEAAVQGVDYDLDLFERVYRGLRGGTFTRFREDFCGTAALACRWVERGRDHRAWAVDVDGSVLDWAREHRLPRLGDPAARLTLVHRDATTVIRPQVDVVAALNFSYWVFKERAALVRYFQAVRRSLAPDGLFIGNAFGGSEAMGRLVEHRRIAASVGVDGRRVPAFRYEWEQASFNPIDHRLVCHIHFGFADGTWMRRAFTYDWRMWTLPEIGDALRDAGFRGVEYYVEGWDEKRNRSDDVYRRRRAFENQESWLACVVGLR